MTILVVLAVAGETLRAFDPPSVLRPPSFRLSPFTIESVRDDIL